MKYPNGDVPETDEEMYAIIEKVKITKTAKKARVYGGDIVASVQKQTTTVTEDWTKVPVTCAKLGIYHSRDINNNSETLCGKSTFGGRDTRFGDVDELDPCTVCVSIAYDNHGLEDLVSVLTLDLLVGEVA